MLEKDIKIKSSRTTPNTPRDSSETLTETMRLTSKLAN